MLIDAGPLVSLCDRRQPSHLACQEVMESVFTLDSDFRIYRLTDGGTLTLLPES